VDATTPKLCHQGLPAALALRPAQVDSAVASEEVSGEVSEAIAEALATEAVSAVVTAVAASDINPTGPMALARRMVLLPAPEVVAEWAVADTAVGMEVDDLTTIGQDMTTGSAAVAAIGNPWAREAAVEATEIGTETDTEATRENARTMATVTTNRGADGGTERYLLTFLSFRAIISDMASCGTGGIYFCMKPTFTALLVSISPAGLDWIAFQTGKLFINRPIFLSVGKQHCILNYDGGGYHFNGGDRRQNCLSYGWGGDLTHSNAGWMHTQFIPILASCGNEGCLLYGPLSRRHGTHFSLLPWLASCRYGL
jgi:hypothetical protein